MPDQTDQSSFGARHPIVSSLAHSIGWLIPGISQEQALTTANNAKQRAALTNMIQLAHQHETDPAYFPDQNDPAGIQRRMALANMAKDLQSQGPFDSPKKIWSQYGEYVANHPHALDGVQPQPTDPTTSPGPAMQGQPNGVPNVIPPVDKSGGQFSASMPGASMIQPSQQSAASNPTPQGGGGVSPFPATSQAEVPSVSGTSTGQPSGVGNTGDQQNPATFSVNKTEIGPDALKIPPVTLPTRPVPRTPYGLIANTPELANILNTSVQSSTQLQHPYVQAQAALDQAIGELQGKTQYQVASAPVKLQMIKQLMGKDDKGNDLWDTSVPPELKSMVINELMGVNIPGIVGTTFASPQLESMDVSKLTPEQRTYFGVPDNMKEGTWTAERNRFGAIVGGYPGRPQERVVQTAQGPQAVNLQSPSAPATPLTGTGGQPLAPTQSFQAYYQKYLSDNKLQHTAYNMQKAWSQWNAASQKPPQALGIPAAGGTAQLIRPGTYVAPGTLSPSGFSGQFTPTTQSKRASELASDIETDIEPRVRTAIDMAEAKIGPGVGRFEKWWVGKGGANDPEYTFLNQALDLYASAIVNVHFGGRGGQAYREALLKNFSQAQSADDLRARIAGADIFLDAYAKGASSRNTAAPPAKPASATTRIPPGPGASPAPKPGDVVSGYTFKGGDPHKQYNWAPAGGR